MDCREFRTKHVVFVDDLLSAAEMAEMQQHLSECGSCARANTAIRRSLLIVHNLPTIEPSADFMVRLNQRIDEMGPVSRLTLVAPRPRLSSIASFAALAAGVAAVAYLAIETSRYFGPQPSITIVPTMASATRHVDAPVDAPIMNAAFVASVPTGIPIWPAMLMVGQAPVRFASMDFHDAEPSR